MCKTLLLMLAVLLAATPAVAQQDRRAKFEQLKAQRQQKFGEARNRRYSEFEEKRRAKNQKFAEYVAKKWEAFELKKGLSKPAEPKPVAPPVAPTKPEPSPVAEKPLPHGDIIPLPEPVKSKPLDIPAMPKEDVKEQLRVNMLFFGANCRITKTSDMRLALKQTDEVSVAAQFKQLASDRYAQLVADCADAKNKMHLNGWATFKFCETVARTIQGGNGNEAVLMQSWLMNQLGYDVRLARLNSNRLIMMCPLAMQAYTFPYLVMDGKTYYIMDASIDNEQIHTYRQNMEDATRVVDFEHPSDMAIGYTAAPKKTVTSRTFPDVKVTVNVNKNLIDYYSTEPYFVGYCWGFYARQPLSQDVSEQLLPPLRKALEGKTEVEKVSMLLDLLQFGFQYAIDEEQFGYEKPFFLEENFYYPQNDCEDRSILLTYLVRQLVGLDAVLLYSPGHLWAAVGFSQPVSGDYVTVDGKRYTVCDPTYIGAGIGSTQPKYRDKQPVVVRCR